MRALVLILLGFGAGLGVGLLWRDEPEPLRWPVRTTAELPPGERAAPPPETEEAEAVVEEPTVPDPAHRAGVGTLEFDGRVDGRVRHAWIRNRRIDGEEDSLEPEWGDDKLQRWQLRAGVHRLCWWHGAREDLRVLEVRIKPGEVTRIAAASTPVAPEQFPMRPGLGRVEVTVFDLENRRAPQAAVEFEYIDIRGEIDRWDEGAAPDGSFRMDVLPGEYVVRVGCQAQPARVVAGQTSRLTFRSRSEGEVRFIGGRYCHLVPTFESKSRTHSIAREANNRADRFIYVRPGLYEAKLAFPGDVKSRVLGRVDVAPGAITEFTTDPLPTANVEVSVKRCRESRAHAVHIELTPLDPGAQPSGWKLKQSFTIDWAHVIARHVSPGSWRLEVHAIECDLITRTIEVGQETQEVKLELQRSTIR